MDWMEPSKHTFLAQWPTTVVVSRVTNVYHKDIDLLVALA